MAFTYQYGANPTIDFPRLLISDTQDENHVFEDSEIMAFYQIQAAQFQSSMFWSFNAGANLPATPVSYLRVAALALDSIASNKSRLSSIIQLMDIKLSPDKAAQALRDQAATYRETEDNAGAFMVIEQVTTTWSFAQRFWSQWMRQQAG